MGLRASSRTRISSSISDVTQFGTAIMSKFELAQNSAYSEGYAYGFFANESIAADEAILIVPAQNVMRATTSEELTARLFCHNAIGEQSPWSHIIRSTLGKPGHSMYEALSSVMDVEALPQVSLAKRRWARAGKALEACPAIFATEPDAAKLLRAWEATSRRESLTLGLWLWAEHQVRSRAFGDDGSTVLPAEATLLNHADAPTVGRHEDGSGAMIFFSVAPMEPGAELTISYGVHSPYEWLRSYEFLPPALLNLDCRVHAPSGREEDGEEGSCPADVVREVMALLAACKEGGLTTACMHAHAMRHDPVAHYNLGVQLDREGDTAAAAMEYKRAAEVSMTPDADVLSNLATAYGVLGRLDESVAAAQTAIAASPRHAPAYHTLGTSLFSLGRVDESTAAYRTAVAIDPSDAGARRNLALNLLHLDPNDREGQQILAHDRAAARGTHALLLLPLLALGGLLVAAAACARGRRRSASRWTMASVAAAVAAIALAMAMRGSS